LDLGLLKTDLMSLVFDCPAPWTSTDYLPKHSEMKNLRAYCTIFEGISPLVMIMKPCRVSPSLPCFGVLFFNEEKTHHSVSSPAHPRSHHQEISYKKMT
jgi:hypothetical protein